MSDPTPYDKLGVSDDASFEEVRDARDRLLREFDGNESQQELIEAAYDAILMDRLRARQEGKIKVPDRIRFPERLSSNLPTTIQTQTVKNSTPWLNNFFDSPTRKEVLVSLAVFGGLTVLGILAPSVAPTWLSLGLMASIYLISTKHNRFGRAVLIALGGLTLAVVIALLVNQIPVLAGPDFPNKIGIAIMLLVMWLVTCFLR